MIFSKQYINFISTLTECGRRDTKHSLLVLSQVERFRGWGGYCSIINALRLELPLTFIREIEVHQLGIYAWVSTYKFQGLNFARAVIGQCHIPLNNPTDSWRRTLQDDTGWNIMLGDEPLHC